MFGITLNHICFKKKKVRSHVIFYSIDKPCCFSSEPPKETQVLTWQRGSRHHQTQNASNSKHISEGNRTAHQSVMSASHGYFLSAAYSQYSLPCTSVKCPRFGDAWTRGAPDRSVMPLILYSSMQQIYNSKLLLQLLYPVE